MAMPSQSFLPMFSKSFSRQLPPLSEPQKDASRVQTSLILSSFHMAIRAVPSLSFCTWKQLCSKLKASCSSLIRQGKALTLQTCSESWLFLQQPQKNTFFLREWPCRSMNIITLRSRCYFIIISLRQWIYGWWVSRGCCHLRLRSRPGAEKRKLPLTTPSMLIMGTILKRKRFLRQSECSESSTSSFRNPYMMNEPPVYPGCTLAEMMITSLLFGLPRFSMGMLRPSQVLPRVCNLILVCSWKISPCNLLRPQGKLAANSTQQDSWFLKKCVNFNSYFLLSSSVSDRLWVQLICVPPLRHLGDYLLSLQQMRMPSLQRLACLVKPPMMNWASPLSPSTEKQNQLLLRRELLSRSRLILKMLLPICQTVPMLPHSKLERKVALPSFRILPWTDVACLVGARWQGDSMAGVRSSPSLCFSDMFLILGCFLSRVLGEGCWRWVVNISIYYLATSNSSSLSLFFYQADFMNQFLLCIIDRKGVLKSKVVISLKIMIDSSGGGRVLSFRNIILCTIIFFCRIGLCQNGGSRLASLSGYANRQQIDGYYQLGSQIKLVLQKDFAVQMLRELIWKQWRRGLQFRDCFIGCW